MLQEAQHLAGRGSLIPADRNYVKQTGNTSEQCIPLHVLCVLPGTIHNDSHCCKIAILPRSRSVRKTILESQYRER